MPAFHEEVGKMPGTVENNAGEAFGQMYVIDIAGYFTDVPGYWPPPAGANVAV